MFTLLQRRHPKTARPKATRPRAGVANGLADEAVPRLPLPAIIAFAATGLGGAFFLAFSTFQSAEGTSSRPLAGETPVYLARAVPREQDDASLGQKLVALAPLRDTARNAAGRGERSAEEPSDVLSTAESEELRGFSGVPSFNASNTFLALAAANLSVGISAQTDSGGHQAPDAETEMLSMVPETSTWMCGIGLAFLVGVRCVRANWHRSRARASRERGPVAG